MIGVLQKVVPAPIAALLLLPALAARGIAQEMDDSPIIAPPFAATFADTATWISTGTNVDATLLYTKGGGFDAPTSGSAPATAIPDFRFELMLRHPRTTTGTVPAGMFVDALTAGLDTIPVRIDPATGNAVLENTGNWNAFMLSIQDDPAASTSTGVIQREELGDGATADVFDIVFSAGPLPSVYTTETMRAQNSDEIDIQGELASLDLHIPAWQTDAGIAELLPARPWVFFSVTTASLANVPGAWWGGDPTAVSGATILFTAWDGSDWTEPRPFATPLQLGVAPTEDVDALSMQVELGGAGVTSFKMVFSILDTSTTAMNDLLYLESLGSGGSPGSPLPIEMGTLAARTGKGNRNIDAVCFYDPNHSQGCPNPPLTWNHVFGAPLDELPFPDPPVARSLHASLLRGGASGSAEISSFAVGWTATGPSPDVTAYHVFAVGDYLGPSTPWFINAVRPASSRLGYGGGPVSASVILPSFVATPRGERCLHLWSVWIAATATDFAQSFPVRIRL